GYMRKAMEPKFAWPRYPSSLTDFETLMQGIDAELARRGLAVYQRPLHIPMLLWDAFGWGGDALPDRSLADRPGYDRSVILAKAYRWYEETFGSDSLKAANFSHGSFAIRLGS